MVGLELQGNLPRFHLGGLQLN